MTEPESEQRRVSPVSNGLTRHARILIVPPLNAPVAQLDRVPGYEPGGRTFESCQARQFRKGLQLSSH
jgi:hypothetical protein